METRTCKTCNEEKPLDRDSYRPTNKTERYFLRECRPCEGKRVYVKKKERMEADPEWREEYYRKERERSKSPESRAKKRESQRAWSQVPENRERLLKSNRERRSTEEGKAMVKNWRLKRDFGISLDDYNRMVESQEGCCLICKDFPPDKSVLVVDHQHSSGNVRGLLCNSCNLLLGHARENCGILLSAVEYINQSVV